VLGRELGERKQAWEVFQWKGGGTLERREKGYKYLTLPN
jgi:hypothetical protein